MSDTIYHFDAEDMAWTCHPQRGVSYKQLRYDVGNKSGAVLIHLCPGASYPRYRAHAGQDVFVVDGELRFGEASVRRGGFVHVSPGSEQEPFSENGCVLFVTFPGNVEHLHGVGGAGG